jgi:hypothetical protein
MTGIILIGAVLVLLLFVLLIAKALRSGSNGPTAEQRHNVPRAAQTNRPLNAQPNAASQAAEASRRRAADWARNPVNPANPMSPLNPASPLNRNNPANPNSPLNPANPNNPINRRR